MHPNVYRIMEILAIMPVTSASVDLSNSSLRFVKTNLRSTVGHNSPQHSCGLLYDMATVHAILQHYGEAQIYVGDSEVKLMNIN